MIISIKEFCKIERNCNTFFTVIECIINIYIKAGLEQGTDVSIPLALPELDRHVRITGNFIIFYPLSTLDKLFKYHISAYIN